MVNRSHVLTKRTPTFNRVFFNESSQPQYALLDNKGNLLQPTRGHNLDVDEYYKFLKKGVKVYDTRMNDGEADANEE